MKTAIIIGVGPDRGLGAQLCKRFAANGLKVIVAGRTKSTVEAVAKDIASSGGQAVPIVADATNEADTVALFDYAGTEIDLAIYNAGNNTPGRVVEMDAEYFERSWRVVCFGGFLFGREAIRRMLPKGLVPFCSREPAPLSEVVQDMERSIRPRPPCGPSRRRWRRNTRAMGSISDTSSSTVLLPGKRSFSGFLTPQAEKMLW